MSTLMEYALSLVTLPEKADILDIGCLNAKTLQYLQSVLDSTGKLVGIDKRSIHFDSPESLAGSGIELVEMDAGKELLFDDESYDFVFSKNVLECIPDKEKHIKEIHRILKQGGRVMCIHADWESIVYNCTNKNLMNKALHAFANWQQGWMDDVDGWIGRRVWGHFNKTKLFDGSLHCFNYIETEYKEGSWGNMFLKGLACVYEKAGLLTQEEYDQLREDVENTAKHGEYMYSYPYYIYVGKKIF